jgi:putative ABC transport system permease protein
VSAVAPAVSGNVQVVHGNRNWRTTMIGAVPAHLVARDWQLASGREMSLEDVERAGKVAILGATVARKLFGEQDPVGTVIRIGDAPFTVVGLLVEKGQTASSRDQDNIVFVPLSTAKLRVLGARHSAHRGAVDYINIKATNAEAVETVRQEVESLLHQRHQLSAGAPDDFTVRNISAIFEAQQDASRTLGILLAAVASVSLLVGGISIMNILLVSVTERTREIGLRMAVGARPVDIRNQFLIEALTLSLLGGVGGVVCGVTAAAVIAKSVGWPILIAPGTILLAVGFSGAVGIFFGFYPALKASRMDPIEALRFE